MNRLMNRSHAIRLLGRASAPVLAISLLAGCGTATRDMQAPPEAVAAAVPAARLSPEVEASLAALAAYRPGADRAAFHAVDLAVRQSLADGAAREAMARRLESVFPRMRSIEASRHVLRHLATIGSEGSVPMASSLALDPVFGDEARFILEQCRGPQADMALRDALARSTGVQRMGLANSVGARRDEGALEILQGFATVPGGEGRAALAAMGRIGTLRSVAALVALNGSGADEAALSHALVDGGMSLLRAGRRREATEAFEAALALGNSPESARIAALGGLLDSDPAQGVEVLLASIETNAPAPGMIAAGLARSAGTRGLDEALAGALPAAGPSVKAAILSVLADRGATSHRAAIREVLAGSSTGPEAAAAAEALGRLGDAEDAMALLSAATRRGAVQEAARAALAALQGDVDPILAGALSDEDASVREEAARALAARGASAQEGALLARVAVEPERRVRVALLRAVGEVGTAPSYGRLLELLLADGMEQDRADLARAMGFVGRRLGSDEARLAPLTAALASSSNDAQVVALLQALSQAGGEPALAEVRPYVKDRRAAVSEAAVRAVASWPDSAALDDLTVLSASANSEALKILSLQGLLRLLGGDSAPPRQETVRRAIDSLELATRPDEKRSALSVLARNAHPDGFDRAFELIDDPQVGAEAFNAAAEIVEGMRRQYRFPARDAAQALVEKAKGDEAREERAAEALALVDEWTGYVVEWALNGPWPAQGGDFFETPLPTEQDPLAQTWRMRRSDFRGAGYRSEMNFINEVGPGPAAMFMMTHAWSDEDRDVRLEMGSDDSIVAWINGEEVHRLEASRAYVPASDVKPARLREGWNQVLVRIDQGGGEWAGGLRIVQPDGVPVPGLRFSPDAEGTVALKMLPDFLGRYSAGDLKIDVMDRGGDGTQWGVAVWSGTERGELQATLDGDRLLLSGDAHGQTWAGAIDADGAVELAPRGGEVLRGATAPLDSPTLEAEPPANASVLLAMTPSPRLDAFDTTTWSSERAPAMRVGTGDARTLEEHGDAFLHLEFRAPRYPALDGQARGNSGVYLQDRYEVQILDSFGLALAGNHCGGIYKVAVPAAAVTGPAATWQTYDIAFRAPRFEGDTMTAPPRVTVFHNGVMIHDDVELPASGTGGAAGSDPVAKAPLRLQDHGDLVRFRNIWLVEPPSPSWRAPGTLEEFASLTGAKLER